MAKHNGSFPHPVLGNHDDVLSSFRVFNAVVSCDVDFVDLKFEFQTDDPDLLQRLDDGRASIAIRTSCSATFFVRTESVQPVARRSNGAKFHVVLDQSDLKGQVNVHFLALCEATDSAFHWQKQHEDYGDAIFAVTKGDILADGGYLTFDASKVFDPMDPPIGSCFRIVPDNRLKKKMQLGFDDEEQIVVAVSEGIAEYLRLHPDLPEIAINCIVFPALIRTVEKINEAENSEEFREEQGFAWYKTIHKMLNDRELLGEDPFLAAQEILQYPIYGLMEKIGEMDDE